MRTLQTTSCLGPVPGPRSRGLERAIPRTSASHSWHSSVVFRSNIARTSAGFVRPLSWTRTLYCNLFVPWPACLQKMRLEQTTSLNELIFCCSFCLGVGISYMSSCTRHTAGHHFRKKTTDVGFMKLSAVPTTASIDPRPAVNHARDPWKKKRKSNVRSVE